MLNQDEGLVGRFFQPFPPAWNGGPPDFLASWTSPLELTLPEIRDRRNVEEPRCPRCQHARVIRWGGFSGRQRYRCRACRRTFSDFTHTPMAYSKYPERWPAHANCLRDGISVREAARRLKVHKDTAWRWRHRLLAALMSREKVSLSGIVELLETTFPHSEKGRRDLTRPRYARVSHYPDSERPRVRVVFAHDRASAAASVLGQAPWIRAKQLRDSLLPCFGEVRLVLSRGGPFSAPARFARSLGIPHRSLRAAVGPKVSSPRHMRSVRRYERRLRAWLVRFRGVATKYLDRYLAWHRLLESLMRPGVGARLLLAGLGISVRTAI